MIEWILVAWYSRWVSSQINLSWLAELPRVSWRLSLQFQAVSPSLFPQWLDWWDPFSYSTENSFYLLKVILLLEVVHACSVSQLCPTICNPMDCSLPGSSVHGILQARILEWIAISFSRGSLQPRGWILVSYIGRQALYHSHLGSPGGCEDWLRLHVYPSLFLPSG